MPRSHASQAEENVALVDLLDALLDKGVVAAGDITLSVADVDLVYVGLRSLLCSADEVSLPPLGRPAQPYDRQPVAASPSCTAGAGGADTAMAGRTQDCGGEIRTHVHSPARGILKETRHERQAEPGHEGEDVPANGAPARRINADPERLEKDLAKLVLTLVEFLRQLMESQTLHRMDRGTLSEEQIERLGRALMASKDKIEELKEAFGLAGEELNLDLGPLGRLL